MSNIMNNINGLVEISTHILEDVREVEGKIVDTSLIIKTHYDEVKEAVRYRGQFLARVEGRVNPIIIEHGKDLVWLKKNTPHGEFNALLAEIGIPERSAQRHMKAYKDTLRIGSDTQKAVKPQVAPPKLEVIYKQIAALTPYERHELLNHLAGFQPNQTPPTNAPEIKKPVIVRVGNGVITTVEKPKMTMEEVLADW